jgi:hypothetical protein
LLVITDRRIETAFAFPVFVAQFKHRPVVSVRAGNERGLDSGFGLDALADVLERLLRRRATEIETNDGELLVTRLDDDGRRLERIERAGRE